MVVNDAAFLGLRRPSRPRALVLSGDGLTGSEELAEAFLVSGFETEVRSLRSLKDQVSTEDLISQYSVLALPGGHSFGDHLSAGRLLALKIQADLRWDLHRFALSRGLVLGVGNGFQALIRLGLFGRDLSITFNSAAARTEDSTGDRAGRSRSAWVKLAPTGNRCLWLKGMGTIELPMASNQGRLVFSPFRKKELLAKMTRLGMICLTYQLDPTGSEEAAAGLCDPSGRVFGLMPHPELFIRWTQHPEWAIAPGRANSPGQGIALFDNAYQEALKALTEAPVF